MAWGVFSGVIVAVAIVSIVYPLLRKRGFILTTVGALFIAFAATEVAKFTAPAAGDFDDPVMNLALQPVDLTNGEASTLVFNMYLHGGPLHLFFNILALIFLAQPLEHRLGTFRMAVLFLVSGIVAATFFGAFILVASLASGSGFFGSPTVYLIGASGAVNGILGAYARLYPKERVSFFIYFVPTPKLPMGIWALIFLGVEAFFVLVPDCGFAFYGGPVANLAHIGGLLAGFALAPLINRLPGQVDVKGRPVDAAALVPLVRSRKDRERWDRIGREEEIPIQLAWADELVARSTCPTCGRVLTPVNRQVRCTCGFRLRY